MGTVPASHKGGAQLLTDRPLLTLCGICESSCANQIASKRKNFTKQLLSAGSPSKHVILSQRQKYCIELITRTPVTFFANSSLVFIS